MTSRERLLAAVSGQTVDQKPIKIWPHPDINSDVSVVSIKRLANAGSSPRAVLAEILSPFSRAIKMGLELARTLQDNPRDGEKTLQALMRETRAEIQIALDSGVDGIFYRLQGAEPKFSTPMEYGGMFLEADRELLEVAAQAPLNTLLVEGGPETYIDFVSDLPAQIFAWDNVAMDIDLSAVKKLRQGCLATADPSADILFGGNFGLLKHMAQEKAETNV